MSAQYTIPAIPTVYRGRRYRSRLEARWAAFFDLLGWTAEYEPYDLGTWSPDFLISEGPWSVLVEVKPDDSLSEGTWGKCIRACERAGLLDQENDPHIRAVLLTRSAPRIGDLGLVEIGWFCDPCLSTPEWIPIEAYLVWTSEYVVPVVRPDIASVDERTCYPLFAAPPGTLRDDMPCAIRECIPHAYSQHTMELWAKATNLVQWIAGGRS